MSFAVPTSLRSGTALAVAGLVLGAYPASWALPALGYQFRPSTELRHLAPTPMKAQDGSAISLGYRVTKHWFFLPYAVTADGFALKLEGKAEPVALDSTQVRALQNDKLLPEALPGTALSWGDWILGSLLWILLLPMLGWFGVSRWRQARLAEVKAASKPAAPVPIDRIAASNPTKPAPANSRPTKPETAKAETALPAKADIPRAPASSRPAPAAPTPANPATAPQPAPATLKPAAPQQAVSAQPQQAASPRQPAAAAPARPAPPQQPSAQKAPSAATAAKPALQEARIKCRVKAKAA